MLNPSFSRGDDDTFGGTYAVPATVEVAVLAENERFDAGDERRLDPFFTDVVWERMSRLALDRLPWEDVDVADICCGGGFLSFHLLRRVRPRSLTLIDVSQVELDRAVENVLSVRPDVVLRTSVADVSTALDAAPTIDVAIGNSFLHHFPDVARGLRSIGSMLRPGGWFASLHEPTPAAVILESGMSLPRALVHLVDPGRFVQRRRPPETAAYSPGTDVWLFEPSALAGLLQESGFVDVRLDHDGLFRPLVTARRALHLTSAHPELASAERSSLARAATLDRALRAIVPSRMHGSVAVIGRTPS